MLLEAGVVAGWRANMLLLELEAMVPSPPPPPPPKMLLLTAGGTPLPNRVLAGCDVEFCILLVLVLLLLFCDALVAGQICCRFRIKAASRRHSRFLESRVNDNMVLAVQT